MIVKLNKCLLLTALAAMLSVSVFAQTDRSEVRKGNRNFKKENYQEADINYRKGLVKDSLSLAANWNLASTLYELNKENPQSAGLKEAVERMDKIEKSVVSNPRLSDYHYNRGNIACASKDWKSAVDEYKQSLLRNPGDIEAKENYIYAKMMLDNQQQQDGQNNQDQNQDDQNKDQNKDQNQNQDQNKDQNQDQNKDQNQDQNQDQNKDQNQDQNNQNDKNNNQNDNDPKITPQAAQQMLQAIQAKEAQTQEKVKKEKAAALKSRKKDKNW